MADQNAKSYLIVIKFDIWGFLKSLVTSPSSTFRNFEFNMAD